jgi:hypothetical protein
MHDANKEETSGKPRLKDTLKNNWLAILENINVVSHDSVRYCHNGRQRYCNNTMHDCDLEPELEKISQ